MPSVEDIKTAQEYVKFMTNPKTLESLNSVLTTLPNLKLEYSWIEEQVSRMLEIQRVMMDNQRTRPLFDMSDAQSTLEVMNSNILDRLEMLKQTKPIIDILTEYERMLEFQSLMIVRNARQVFKLSKTK